MVLFCAACSHEAPANTQDGSVFLTVPPRPDTVEYTWSAKEATFFSQSMPVLRLQSLCRKRR